MDWIRVTKREPCPICKKDSWCLVNHKIQRIICMRETSPRMKQFRDGQMGWIHPLDPSAKPPERKEEPVPPPTINCRALMEQWAKQTDPEQILDLASDLQVSVQSVRALEFSWSPEHRAWAIPMKDGYGNMVGIRLRARDGRKWSVRGSHSGCFIPLAGPKPMALVVEGPTDTAAGLDLGFYTVGRPAASGGINELKHLFRRKGVRRAAIVADNDTVGVAGAKMLSDHIGVPSCLITLPCKDLREFVRCGGDNSLLVNYVESSIWNRAT